MRWVLRALAREWRAAVRLVVMFLPDSGVGNKARRWYWRRQLGSPTIAHVGFGARADAPSGLVLGDAFVLGEYSVIEAADSDPVCIGSNVSIARGGYVRSANHRFDDLSLPAARQGHSAKQIQYKGKVYSIVIGDGAWIGANVTILSGAHIGDGAIIAAGSVVIAGEIPPFAIAGGNPARVLANRDRSPTGQTLQHKAGT